MTKILFIGDIHGKNKSPLNRLKDYNEDLFTKLRWVVDFCAKEEVAACIHLGDIHDKTDATDEWKNQFIQVCRGFTCDFYTIIGNHDLPYNNEQLYYKTCLRNLELSGAIQILREPLEYSGLRIVPVPYDLSKAKQFIVDDYLSQKGGTYSIYLAHHFYEFGLQKNQGFVESDFEQTKGFKAALVLGHDHRQFDTITVNDLSIFRPGSLMRTELSEATISMHPRILLYDNESALSSWRYINVPHRDINEIYDVADYRARKTGANYFKQISNALDNMDKYLKADSVSMISCSDALKELNCPKEEYDYLRLVYSQCNQQFSSNL